MLLLGQSLYKSVPGEHLDEGGVDSVSLRHVGAGEAVVPELETDIPAGPGDGGGDPGVQDGVVGLEDLGEDDGLSVVGEAGDGVDRHSSLLSHHVKHRQLSLLVQLDLVTPHPGPGLARLTDDDKSRYLQKTSQACEDDYEISGYMIAVLFEETRSPREVEQEDRQRVMFLSAWIDSTPCKL